MNDPASIDYSMFDVPHILMFLFHPRKEYVSSHPPDAVDLMIPVEEGVSVGARFHRAVADAPTILFFHGNGEIVADYDDLAPYFQSLPANFLAVDYRGYGRSGGKPTVTAMMRDCHAVLQYVREWLKNNHHHGPLVVMGRSLGSASALELARHYPGHIDGLIIESGFAYVGPLLRLLGVDMGGLDPDAAHFQHVQKIKTYEKPTLVIHAEYDHIIPYSDGRALFEASAAPDKQLLMIPGANHNDIHMRGLREYLAAVADLLKKAAPRPALDPSGE